MVERCAILGIGTLAGLCLSSFSSVFEAVLSCFFYRVAEASQLLHSSFVFYAFALKPFGNIKVHILGLVDVCLVGSFADSGWHGPRTMHKVDIYTSVATL